MKLVFVVGPTASGKSHFALESACYLSEQKIKAEILNCDSLQVYKSLDIGTAKPSNKERARVAHHLYDFVELGGSLTAGDYRKMALEKLKERKLAGVSVMFVVGGSGFYFYALEHGMFDLGKVPESIHDDVQAQAAENLAGLYSELEAKDPEYAKKIGSQDAYRIQRAVELIRFYGDSPTNIRKRFKPEPLGYELSKFGFTRQRSELKTLIEARTERMLRVGLIDEVRMLLDLGLEEWAPLSSVGYKETVSFLKGEIRETELFAAIVQKTMSLAKKQMTWFKRDPAIQWYDSEKDFHKAFERLALTL